jgi:DNA-binding MarR family transcriptional regulator
MVKQLAQDELHRTADLFHSVAIRILRAVRAVDAGMSLDGPRASLLSVLVFAGPRPVTALADIEQVSAPAITKMVTALEREGLVERRRSAQDRRVVMVAATSTGRRLLEKGRAARVREVERLLAELSPGELRTVRRAAELIRRSLALRDERGSG